MPGYVLAKLALNDDVYHLVKNTAEGDRLPGHQRQAAADFRPRGRPLFRRARWPPPNRASSVSVDYEIGDSVKVLDGPVRPSTASSRNSISTRTVSRSPVSIFGRATPVELDFEHVELVK
jgi:transcriptional antiterminator NusG